jgi:hypothetical protein
VTPDKLGNLRVRFIGMEQDVGMPDRGGRRFTTVNKVFEERTLVVGKGNGVLALPHEKIYSVANNIILLIIFGDKRH